MKNSLFLISLFFLSSCSSLGLNIFSSNDDENSTEPKKLIPINEKVLVKENWSRKFSGEKPMGNFEVAFSGGTLFFSDSSGNIYSIDAKTGKTNWNKKLELLSSGISYGYSTLVVSDNDGVLYALDSDNGNIIWKSELNSEIFSTAAIDASHIIVKTSPGDLLSFDRKSGDLIWSYKPKLPSLTIRGSSSPVLDNDTVVATFDNGRLGVFQTQTGLMLWDSAISYVSGTSELENLIDADSKPLIDERLIIASNYQGNLSIFDKSQKRMIWSTPISSFYEPILLKSLVIVIKDDSSLVSFSKNTLSMSWEKDDYKNRGLSNGAVYKSYLIIGDAMGYLHVVDPLTGVTIGRKKISRNGIITIQSRTSDFFVVDDKFNLYSFTLE